MHRIELSAFEARARLRDSSKFTKLLKTPIKFTTANAMRFITKKMNRSLELQATTFWGEKMYVVFPEGMSSTIYQYGSIDVGQTLTRSLLHYLKPGMTFFDVGSHYGYFSLLASHIVGDSGQVHAFEPTPRTFRTLQKNAATKKNIHANHNAAWHYETELTLQDYGLFFSGFNSVFDARLENNHKEETAAKKTEYNVQAITIDGYVERTGACPDFVKIDAESAEPYIIQGMANTLAQHKPILALEIGDMGVEGAMSSKELVSVLEGLGYLAYDFADGQFVKHELQETYGVDNLIFMTDKHR